MTINIFHQHSTGPRSWTPHLTSPIVETINGKDAFFTETRTIDNMFTSRLTGIDVNEIELLIDFKASYGHSTHRRSVLSNQSIRNHGLLEQYMAYEWAIITLIEGLRELLGNINRGEPLQRDIELFEETILSIYCDDSTARAFITNTNIDDTHVFHLNECNPFIIGGGDYAVENGKHRVIMDIQNVMDTLSHVLGTFRQHKETSIKELMGLPYVYHSK